MYVCNKRNNHLDMLIEQKLVYLGHVDWAEGEHPVPRAAVPWTCWLSRRWGESAVPWTCWLSRRWGESAVPLTCWLSRRWGERLSWTCSQHNLSFFTFPSIKVTHSLFLFFSNHFLNYPISISSLLFVLSLPQKLTIIYGWKEKEFPVFSLR